ncbi:MAG: hypothetical protein HN712_15520 [Gemmatimonadetes bacterium]|nr:hypothetical protein [Gemmatimonadota bacterium]MBT6144010.1 hypothetical protein [Gemmatimonadota bacterium]MBT7861731.1 hypothetical protein [Gemmatimonadota bacterium]
MEEVIGIVALGSLAAFALVKAYTGKVLTQLRAECGVLITQERHLRQGREHEETQLQGAEARLEQLELDKSNLAKDAEGMASDIERVDTELHRLKPDLDEEMEGDPVAEGSTSPEKREDE